MHCRHQRLDEGQPTASESSQDSDHVARTIQQLEKITVEDVPLLTTEVTVVDSARNLGVIIDSKLSLNAHVAAVCRSGYYQLWQLRPVTGSLSCLLYTSPSPRD